jgi:hypothetical protein
MILTVRTDCEAWQGVPDDYPASEGDYGLACAVDDYVGLVDFRGRTGLVLGEEPVRTTFLDQDKLLVRMVSAEPGVDVVATVRRQLPTVSWQSTLVWNVCGPVVLFDSSMSGQEALAGEHLVVDLEAGSHTVEAAYASLDGMDVILVKFEDNATA